MSDGTDARMGTLTAGLGVVQALAHHRRRDHPAGRGAVGDPHQGRVRILSGCSTSSVTSPCSRSTRDVIVKKTAGYHQYWAANKAVASTLRAIGARGDGRVGVVWHTQGSGKSLTMLFYAGKIIQEHGLQNPTVVVLTDRNDFDDQLFDQFALGHELLRQTPIQAESRAELREKLRVAAGGVVFTTIQKFLPEDVGVQHAAPFSDRSNIIFIVDEAHRTQYGFEAHYVKRDDGLHRVYGLAKYLRDALPNAAFIGFTGTPVSLTDRDTRSVFGEYIDIYDIQRAVEDQATVPIYYDARHAKLRLNERDGAPHRPRL